MDFVENPCIYAPPTNRLHTEYIGLYMFDKFIALADDHHEIAALGTIAFVAGAHAQTTITVSAPPPITISPPPPVTFTWTLTPPSLTPPPLTFGSSSTSLGPRARLPHPRAQQWWSHKLTPGWSWELWQGCQHSCCDNIPVVSYP
ncbi:hypothetical protein AZE42_07935 [Rhizopogon vesiculosus]|uniref:Uncharacterized protein n=1 Tax=Rhizopogon vesiculosus TaxID=180088 RepID=A0A1J8Q2A5_9AGAM|nr:hypothetical protein AZE42_07935 [Rhizopogon vesiculosus]